MVPRQKSHWILAWIGTAAFCSPMVGCSNHPELQKIDTVPVVGRVTLDGRPLPQGQGSVSCSREGPNRITNYSVRSLIDDAGRFELQTHLGLDQGYSGLFASKRGAPVGTYKVEVRLYERFNEKRHDWKNPQKLLIPMRYTDFSKSGLVIEVVRNPAPGAYDLKLTSDEPMW